MNLCDDLIRLWSSWTLDFSNLKLLKLIWMKLTTWSLVAYKVKTHLELVLSLLCFMWRLWTPLMRLEPCPAADPDPADWTHFSTMSFILHYCSWQNQAVFPILMIVPQSEAFLQCCLSAGLLHKSFIDYKFSIKIKLLLWKLFNPFRTGFFSHTQDRWFFSLLLVS